MKERLLIEFLSGQAPASHLSADLADAYIQRSHDVRDLNVEFHDRTFLVTRRAMLRVCDSVLDGDLAPGLLEPIGDCLMMSETFLFDEADAELLRDVAHCWGAPETCYPLDIEHAKAFRRRLETGRDSLG